MDNLARRGPKKVWKGYKTMRVPVEIFDDVRKFMERRKQEYLAEQEGILDEVELPHSSAYSLPPGASKEEMSEIIRAAIREELQNNPGGLNKGDVMEIPPPTLTSQERVKQLLMQRPGQELTTLQIAEMLDLPNSTAREATRTIADDIEQVKKKSGRPNRFIYIPDEE